MYSTVVMPSRSSSSVGLVVEVRFVVAHHLAGLGTIQLKCNAKVNSHLKQVLYRMSHKKTCHASSNLMSGCPIRQKNCVTTYFSLWDIIIIAILTKIVGLFLPHRVQFPLGEEASEEEPVEDHGDDEEGEGERQDGGLDGPQHGQAAHLAQCVQVHLPGTNLRGGSD